MVESRPEKTQCCLFAQLPQCSALCLKSSSTFGHRPCLPWALGSNFPGQDQPLGDDFLFVQNGHSCPSQTQASAWRVQPRLRAPGQDPASLAPPGVLKIPGQEQATTAKRSKLPGQNWPSSGTVGCSRWWCRNRNKCLEVTPFFEVHSSHIRDQIVHFIQKQLLC